MIGRKNSFWLNMLFSCDERTECPYQIIYML